MLDENRKKREISMEGKIINRGMEYGTEAFSHLPEKVKNLPTCCWKKEIRDGKRTKVPYDP